MADRAPLRLHQLRDARAGSGEQDEEGDVGIVARRKRRDHAALAMADEADRVPVDLGPRGEESEGGVGVGGEIGAGRARISARGSGGATIVVAQHRDSGAGQAIGKHRERLVAENGLVAIFRPRARNQDRGRERTAPGRQGQRSGQSTPGARVLAEMDLLGPVGEWRARQLRPGAGRRRRLRAANEGDFGIGRAGASSGAAHPGPIRGERRPIMDVGGGDGEADRLAVMRQLGDLLAHGHRVGRNRAPRSCLA